jgi:hypothetical protein
MNTGEPLLKYRENEHPNKTTELLLSEEEYSGNLFTGCMFGVIKRA